MGAYATCFERVVPAYLYVCFWFAANVWNILLYLWNVTHLTTSMLPVLQLLILPLDLYFALVSKLCGGQR